MSHRLELRPYPLGLPDELLFHERFPDLNTLRLQECEDHPAADDERIHLLCEIPDHRDLRRHLRPADDRDERSLGIVERLAHDFELFSDQKAADARQNAGDPLGRRMSPVRRSKGIVDIYIREGRELFRESGIVLLFLRMEADVFEHHDLSAHHF